MLKTILTSKKALAAIVAVIMALVGKKIGLDEQTVTLIVGAIASYVVGQGIADNGKEAVIAKEKA